MYRLRQLDWGGLESCIRSLLRTRCCDANSCIELTDVFDDFDVPKDLGDLLQALSPCFRICEEKDQSAKTIGDAKEYVILPPDVAKSDRRALCLSIGLA